MKLINKKLRLAFGIEDLAEATEEVILPQAVEIFDSKLVITKAVTIDAKDEALKKGSTVKIDYPIEFGDAEEMTDDRKGVNSEIEMRQVELKIDRYKHKQFSLKETEILGTRSDFILSSAQTAAITAVARTVEKDLYNEVYKATGLVAGDLTSANARDRKDLIAARKALKNHGLVEDEQKLLMHIDTEADLLTNMANVLSGDENLERKGILGERMGFQLMRGTYAPEHVAGSASANAGLTINTATEEDESLVVSGFEVGETLSDGDILMIADGSSYSVKGVHTATAADMTVAVYQEIEADIESGTTLTVVDSHNVDLALHSSCATISFRKLKQKQSDSRFAVSMTHPGTGIPLTIRYFEDETGRVESWAVEVLYGIKVFNDLGRCVRMGGH